MTISTPCNDTYRYQRGYAKVIVILVTYFVLASSLYMIIRLVLAFDTYKIQAETHEHYKKMWKKD